MSTALPVTATLYDDLGSQYADALARYDVEAAILTHKWQPGDLLAPHSDLDIRILLDGPPTNWRQWNENLAHAHSAAVAAGPGHRRWLEHPPGFAFTLAEVRDRRVAPSELVTWSVITGHARSLQQWKSRAQMAPWGALDERFYRGILAGRLHGRYRLEADSTDNVDRDLPGYRRHCVTWHYLAPCWFAAAALATRTRCPGKTAALHQWHPAGLQRYARFFLRHIATPAEPDRPASLRVLMRAAHVALDTALRHVPAPAAAAVDDDCPAQAVARTMAAGMLRVRRARWLYYLDPPTGVITDYLISREAKELRSAAAALRTLAADQATADQRLAARMADLIPTGPSTALALRQALADWDRHHAVVEDFLSAHTA